MKQLLQQYAAYNLWANKKIIETANQLSEEQVNKEIVSSFPSVYKTFLHLMEVEYVWWERLKLTEHDTPSGWFTGDFTELSKKLLELSRQWQEWIESANEVNITHVFAYQNSKKEHFKQPVYEMLLHLFNHQTLHRGQLITMFRQLGLNKIPPTDFIVWSRKK
ncbi:MAG: DinB family protein [Chitinophagaceae bacterium]|nr:DinB family protein [Chitinophagaceae bacterium]